MSDSHNHVVFRKSTRVTLCPLSAEHLSCTHRWINDPEVHQFLNSYLPMMEEDQKEWLEKVHKQKQNNIVFMIVADGKPIGSMGIHNIDHRQGTATTGALIGEKEYWGRGYGSEAKMLLLEYAFNVLNLRKIYSNVISFNDRSYRYSLKCGYQEEARLKDHMYVRGEYWDFIWLSVYRKDWQPLWGIFANKHEGHLLF